MSLKENKMKPKPCTNVPVEAQSLCNLLDDSMMKQKSKVIRSSQPSILPKPDDFEVDEKGRIVLSYDVESKGLSSSTELLLPRPRRLSITYSNSKAVNTTVERFSNMSAKAVTSLPLLLCKEEVFADCTLNDINR